MINYQCQVDLDSCAIAVITVISSHPVTVSNKRLLYCCRMAAWWRASSTKMCLLNNDLATVPPEKNNLAIHRIQNIVSVYLGPTS